MASRYLQYLQQRKSGGASNINIPSARSYTPTSGGSLYSKYLNARKQQETEIQAPVQRSTSMMAIGAKQPNVLQATKQSYFPRPSETPVNQVRPSFQQMVGLTARMVTPNIQIGGQNLKDWTQQFGEGAVAHLQGLGENILAPTQVTAQTGRPNLGQALTLSLGPAILPYMVNRLKAGIAREKAVQQASADVAKAVTPEEKQVALTRKLELLSKQANEIQKERPGALDKNYKQIVGEIGQTVLDIATLGGTSAVTRAGSLGIKGLTKGAASVVEGGLIGAGYGLGGAMQANQNLPETIKSTVLGGNIGASLAAGGAALGTGMSRYAQYMRRKKGLAMPEAGMVGLEEGIKVPVSRVGEIETKVPVKVSEKMVTGKKMANEVIPINKLLDSEGDILTETSTKIATGEKSMSKGPIDVVGTSDGYVVLDGQHRAVEAMKSGKPSIEAKILTPKEAKIKYGSTVPTLDYILEGEINVPKVSKGKSTTGQWVESEGRGMIPGESFEEYKVKGKTKAVITQDEDSNKWYIAREDGSLVDNPNSDVIGGSPLFNTIKEAKAEFSKVPSAPKSPEITSIVKPAKIQARPVSPVNQVVEPFKQPQRPGPALSDVVKQLPRTTGTKERGFISTIKESSLTPEALKNIMTADYTPSSNKVLTATAKKMINDDIGEARKFALKGGSDLAVETANELIGYYSRARDYEMAASIAKTAAENLTEMGRAVQAAALYNKLTPEGILRFAQREIQKYNEGKIFWGVKKLKKPIALSARDAELLSNRAKAIQAMPEGKLKMIATQKMLDMVSDLIPTPAWKKFITTWKAGLLSGLKTSERNIVANTIGLATDVVSKGPASIVDAIAALKTGERATTTTLRGYPSGWLEGGGKALEFLKTGVDERNVGQKYDLLRTNWGKNKLEQGLKKITDFVFRNMGAQDQVFYYGALRNSLFDQATAQAKNARKLIKAGKKAVPINIEKLAMNPTAEMQKVAVAEAMEAVYQNPTTLGKIAIAARRAMKGGGAVPEFVFEFLFPFTRTPSAVATRFLDYSPIGFLRAVKKSTIGGEFNQRMFSRIMGRAITGSGLMALGATLAKYGFITLDSPTSEKEKNQWDLEGKKPFSIRVGNRWLSINSLGPQMTALIAGAYFSTKGKISESVSSLLGKTPGPVDKEKGVEEGILGIPARLLASVLGGGKALKEQTFVKGMSSMLDALDEPGRYAQSFIEQSFGSLIPTLLADIARGTDTDQRQVTKQGSLPASILQTIMERLPIMRTKLLPKLNVLGEIKKGNGFVLSLVDLFSSSPATSRKIVEEFGKYEVTPTYVQDSITRSGQEMNLTQQQNFEYQKLAGEIILRNMDRLLGQASYQKLSDEDKKKAIQDLITDSKTKASEQLFGKIKKTKNVGPKFEFTVK